MAPSKVALLLWSGANDCLEWHHGAIVGALEMQHHGSPATKTVSSLQQLCSRKRPKLQVAL